MTDIACLFRFDALLEYRLNMGKIPGLLAFLEMPIKGGVPGNAPNVSNLDKKEEKGRWVRSVFLYVYLTCGDFEIVIFLVLCICMRSRAHARIYGVCVV
jgi:hypothetical protein